MPKKIDQEMTRFTMDATAKTRTMLEKIMREYGIYNPSEMIRVLIHEKHETFACRDEKNKQAFRPNKSTSYI